MARPLHAAIAAVSLGVLEYLVKPMSTDQLARVLGRASKLRRAGGLTSRARTAAPAEARRLVGGRPSWPPLARLSPEFQQLDAEE